MSNNVYDFCQKLFFSLKFDEIKQKVILLWVFYWILNFAINVSMQILDKYLNNNIY